MNWESYWKEKSKGTAMPLIDVRAEHEYAESRVDGAINIPKEELVANPEKYLDKNTQYYVHCRSGGRSGWTELMLKAKGYTNVKNIGGILECQQLFPEKVSGKSTGGACQIR